MIYFYSRPPLVKIADNCCYRGYKKRNLRYFFISLKIHSEHKIVDKMLFLLAITILGLSIRAEAVTNFCDARLCGMGGTNIGCYNSGRMQCADTVVLFNSSLIALTLDEHNRLRQKIASGNEPGFPPAARMTTMVSIVKNQRDQRDK